jgi:aspartate/methionine/tyrosine aminotransferase
VAADFRRRGIVISADRVALTASTSEAYGLLFKLLCDAGDQVLVPRPSYPLFEHLTRLEAVTAVPYDLEYHGAWRIDLESVRRALNPRVKALLVVSPNNPTGSFLHRDDLAALAAMSVEHGWPIIGDEVFADYAIEPAPFATSVLAASEALTFSLGGLSKSAGLPQVKLGWIGVGGPAAKVDRALAHYEMVADTYLSVSTPVQLAAPSLVESGGLIRAQLISRIQENLGTLRTLASAIPSVDVLPVEGGWSAIIQVPAIGSEDALALQLLDQDDVLVHPGYFFDFAREAFVVVSLIVKPGVFGPAIARVLRRASGAPA